MGQRNGTSTNYPLLFSPANYIYILDTYKNMPIRVGILSLKMHIPKYIYMIGEG